MPDPHTTIPGGYYIGVDGRPHDAFGNPVPERPQPEPESGEISLADGVDADEAKLAAKALNAAKKAKK